MSTQSRFMSGATIAIALLCLFVGFVIGKNMSSNNEKAFAKTQATIAERKAAEEKKELTALAAPPTERIYTTSRGDLLMLGVKIKPKNDEIQNVACFVWIGNAGHTAMDCPQNPIDLDAMVEDEIDMRAKHSPDAYDGPSGY